MGYEGIEDVYLAGIETDGSFYASPQRQEQLGPSIHY